MCAEYPDGIAQVSNDHYDAYAWDPYEQDYVFDECIETGDTVRVECRNGHLLEHREVEDVDNLTS